MTWASLSELLVKSFILDIAPSFSAASFNPHLIQSQYSVFLSSTRSLVRRSLWERLVQSEIFVCIPRSVFSCKPNLLKQSFLSPDRKGMSNSMSNHPSPVFDQGSQHIHWGDDCSEMGVSKVTVGLLGVTEPLTPQTSSQWVNHLKGKVS